MSSDFLFHSENSDLIFINLETSFSSDIQSRKYENILKLLADSNSL
jgi:hypothetical protein